MLKYTINNKNIKSNLRDIKFESFYSKDYSKEKIYLKCDDKNLLPSDVLSFIRTDGKDLIHFMENRGFVKKDNSLLEIDSFPDYIIKPTMVYDITDFKNINNKGESNAICFVFDNERHDFFEDREISIAENINTENYGINKNKRRCPNDYIVYKNIYLMKSTGVDDENYYTFGSENLNTKQDIYFFKDGEKIILKDCIIPVLSNGQDNRRLLYWGVKDKKISTYIKENFNNIIFYTIDNRFFFNTDKKDENDNIILEFRKNSNVNEEEGHVKLNLMFNENFEINMNQQENYENYLDDLINENINPVVDMERQIFYPSIVNENNEIICDNVKSLLFNIKLRKRCVGNETIENIIDAWENNEIGNEWWKKSSETSDLMGYLGFTDDDIYYRKNNVKKSFLRLSFYDTKNRNTQSLLFYSTLFFDSGKLYSKYIKNISMNSKEEGKEMVLIDFNDKIGTNIDASFIIKNKFDYTNCSEGYYLYLFPNLCNGIEPTTIYMKAEFNNAKFGYTIPLMVANGNIKDYYIPFSGGTENMKALFDDLYCPINIMYNKEKNMYFWNFTDRDGVKSDKEKNEYSITLYEPVINQYEI